MRIAVETWVPNLLSMKDKGKVTMLPGYEVLASPGLEEHEHREAELCIMNMILAQLSPHRAMKMVESIRDQLVHAYPDKKKTFEKST